MSGGQIAGIALFALGLVLLFFGFTATDSVLERGSKALTGEYTNQTMFYIIGGIVSAVAGLGLLLFGARKEPS